MANMNPKDLIIEIEEMRDREESVVAPHSNSSNHFKDQVQADVVVDIKAMLKDIKKPPLLTTSCCIYKAPSLMREANEDAFTPRIISIGPLHHGNQRLRNMETHKRVFFKEFVEEAEISLDDLVSFVNNLEPRVRACYSEEIEEELVRVILVDAGFIIRLFKRSKEGLRHGTFLSKPWLSERVINDLLLLENQLPFFLLEELFNHAFPLHIRDGLPSFQKLTLDFFSGLNTKELDPEKDFTINHFTDLLRSFHLQEDKPDIKGIDTIDVSLYRASVLQEAGMKFKVSKSQCLLDLKILGGVLEIPQITVDDNTEMLFLNMLALEQCHYPMESYIAHYALLLKWLINTSKDVDLLVKEGIISNYLADSNEVAKLFNNKLGKHLLHVTFNSDYYDICKKLYDFYKNPWNNMKATLRRDYCTTPWKTAASIAGIVLLILTLVQTIFAIIK